MTSRAIVLLVLGSLISAVPPMARAADGRALNVVVVTGGHDYDTKVFPKLYEGQGDFRVTEIRLKDDSELFEDISEWKYDVIVMYNMTQRISAKRQANFLKLLDRGVGLVVLHHCLGSYQDWPEFARVAGGKYLMKDMEIGGVKRKGSTYQHDIVFKVKVEDPDHFITKGVKDFTLVDESYKGQWIDPSVHVLLSTTERTSDTALAWCKTYGKAKVVCIQLGHGPQAYTDANYRQILAQSIRWTAVSGM